MAPTKEMKDLLEMQQNIYKDMVTVLFSTISKKVDEQQGLISDLKHSLEFSQAEIVSINSQLKQSNCELSQCKKQINDQENEIEKLKFQLSQNEDYTKRKNIRVEGLPEVNQENYEQTEEKINKLFKEKLQLQNISIDVAHRLPLPSNLPSNRKNTRTVLVSLTSLKNKENVMKVSHRLKNTGIFLNDDLSENTLKIRKEKMPQLLDARKEGKIAYFRRDKLIIKDRQNYKNYEKTEMRQSYTPPRPVSSLIDKFTPQHNLDNDILHNEASPNTSVLNRLRPRT